VLGALAISNVVFAVESVWLASRYLALAEAVPAFTLSP
jgi:hypothetical protein